MADEQDAEVIKLRKELVAAELRAKLRAQSESSKDNAKDLNLWGRIKNWNKYGDLVSGLGLLTFFTGGCLGPSYEKPWSISEALTMIALAVGLLAFFGGIWWSDRERR